MKTQLGMYFDSDVAQELRHRAERAGVAIGDLASLLCKGGLAKLSDEQIRSCLSKQTPTRGRLGGGLRKAERQVLEAFNTLKASDPESRARPTRFTGGQLAQEAGLHLTETLLALKALKARSLVSGEAVGDFVDRWGRPLESAWWLASDVQVMAVEPVFELLREVRELVGAQPVDPTEIYVIEQKVSRATGLNARAIRLPRIPGQPQGNLGDLAAKVDAMIAERISQ